MSDKSDVTVFVGSDGSVRVNVMSSKKLTPTSPCTAVALELELELDRWASRS